MYCVHPCASNGYNLREQRLKDLSETDEKDKGFVHVAFSKKESSCPWLLLP